MKNIIGVSLLLLSIGFPSVTIAADGCIGKVAKLWVEYDDSLYFNIQPTNECVCNFSENGIKGFKAPADQLNKDEQYSALLAAFMADKEVMAWFDWVDAEGNNRCKSWNISMSK